MSNELQKNMTIKDIIKAQTPAIAKAVGGATEDERKRRAERFARICLTALIKTPKLETCTPESFAGALMTCAQLDLEPNTPQGLAYLIPYYNNKTKKNECQFQIGYKGLMQLMYRSGLVASFNADVVYRGEVEDGSFKYESGVRPTIEHHINLLDDKARTGNPKDIVAAYAAVVLKTGEPVMRLVTKKEIENARRLNQGNSPAWNDHYDAMAIKTAIKRLSSWMPQTEMIALAVESDSKADREVAAANSEAISADQLNNALAASAATPALPEPAPAVDVEPTPAPEPETKGAPSGGAGPQGLKGAENPAKPDPASAAEKLEEKPLVKDTPQFRLMQALGEQCDGDAVEMQRLFNTVVGDDKHLLDHISGYTDFVAERYLQLLEDHLAKIEGGAK